MGTQRYLLGKLLQALLTLFFIIAFNFLLFRVMPGDPVKMFTRSANVELSAEQQERLKERLGLLEPLPQQYIGYLGDTFRGDLGVSTFVEPGENVSTVFFRDLPKYVVLVGTSTIASVALGLVLGISGGWKRGRALDVSSMTGSLVVYSMPEFVLGILLLLFFTKYLHLFPSGGYKSVTGNFPGLAYVADVLNHMMLPSITLTLAYLGEYYLVMRSSLLDVLGEEYITLARAKGIREKFVLRRHAVRNALLPTVTLVALSVGFILGGAVAVELVFSYPESGNSTSTPSINMTSPSCKARSSSSALGSYWRTSPPTFSTGTSIRV